MQHAIFSQTPSILSIRPVRGQIVRIEKCDDYIVAASSQDGYLLISLKDGNRWCNEGLLTWNDLTANRPGIIFHVWSSYADYVKDVK